MTSDERKSALMRAKWRADLKKSGDGQCRLCGSRTLRLSPYCWRHWKALSGNPELMHAAAEGRELDTADMIASLSTAFTLRYVKAHEIRISDTQSLRWNSTNGWNLYKTPSSGVEYLDRSFKTVKEARDYLMALRQTMSTHNRYAKKKLIR